MADGNQLAISSTMPRAKPRPAQTWEALCAGSLVEILRKGGWKN